MKKLNLMQNELKEIPEGILNEINLHYDNVILDLESDITKNTVTRLLKYRDISEDVETTNVMNPITFELRPVTGHSTRTYMVRLENTDDQCIVRRILFAGDVITPQTEEE